MKSFFITLFLMLTCLVSQAQNESIYYSLIHPETKAESFLLGTYHHYPEGWYEIPSEVKEAMSKSSSLITEAGTAKASKYSRKIDQIIRYKPSKTVLDKLKGEEKEKFQKYMEEKIGGSESAKFETLNRKPYFLLGRLFALRFSDSVMHMETQLKALAINNNIPVQGLEPNEKRFYKYAKKYANKLKPTSLGLLVEIQMLSTATLFAEYLDGNISEMSKRAGGASTMSIERNQYWVPQLVKMLKKPSFIAVGTGHLIGDLAIQELLKKEGFIVTPIPLSQARPQALIDLLSEIDPPQENK